MKRFLFVFAVLAVSIALVACSGNGTDTTVDDGTTPPVVDEATEHVHNFVDEIIPAMIESETKHFLVEQDNAAYLPDTLGQVERSIKYLKANF